MRRLSALSVLVALSLTTIRLVHATVYQSIDDLPLLASSNLPTYDFIIVGGGGAGGTIAGRLSENPAFKVLLIEAGPDNEGREELLIPSQNLEVQANSSYIWGWYSTPQIGVNNRSIEYKSGHVLGGGTGINGMVYTRGADDDYDQWGKVSSDKKWSWKALAPYIKKHEKWVQPPGGRNISQQYDPRVHGYQGQVGVSLPWSSPIDFDARCLRNTELQAEFDFNLDPNSGKPIGVTWTQFTVGAGERTSSATSYLGPSVRKRPNLSILVNTYAKRVLETRDGPTFGLRKDIRTVEIVNRSGKGASIQVTAKKEVILTAGAIGTPKILLDSGIGNKGELEKVGVKSVANIYDVGKALSDHLTVSILWSANGTDAVVNTTEALDLWRKERVGPYSEPTGPRHQILWSRLPSNSSLLKKYQDPAAGSNSPHFEITLSGGGSTVFSFISLLTPHSRGSVTIKSADPLDPPLIDLAFLTHPFDKAAVIEGIRQAKRFYSGHAWDGYITGFLGPDPDVDTSPKGQEEFWDKIKVDLNSFFHPCGTAAISPKGSGVGKGEGVVDSDLKVKTVKGLRVADAAVIPHVPTAHTQAAVYILAERASSLIKEQWQ